MNNLNICNECIYIHYFYHNFVNESLIYTVLSVSGAVQVLLQSSLGFYAQQRRAGRPDEGTKRQRQRPTQQPAQRESPLLLLPVRVTPSAHRWRRDLRHTASCRLQWGYHIHVWINSVLFYAKDLSLDAERQRIRCAWALTARGPWCKWFKPHTNNNITNEIMYYCKGILIKKLFCSAGVAYDVVIFPQILCTMIKFYFIKQYAIYNFSCRIEFVYRYQQGPIVSLWRIQWVYAICDYHCLAKHIKVIYQIVSNPLWYNASNCILVGAFL